MSFNYTVDHNHTVIYNSSLTDYNSYTGGVFQQAVSAVTVTDQTAYELNGGGFSIYGFEYQPGADNAVRLSLNLHRVSI